MSAKKSPAKKAAPPRLTSDQLDKIKHADVSNLIRKVKSGKTLTAAERKTLEQAAGSEDELPPELVTTTRLAELFQVNRKSIAQWRLEKRPGIPAKVDNKEPLAEWRAYFAANPSAGHYDGKPRKDRESLLCDKLEVEIEIKQLQRDEEKGDLIRVNDVRESVIRHVTAARSEFLKMANDLPPRISGLPESKVQSMIREAVIQVLSQLSENALKPYKENETKPG